MSANWKTWCAVWRRSTRRKSSGSTSSRPNSAESLAVDAAPAEAAAGEGLAAAVERHISDYFAAHRGALPAAGLYDRVLREVERPLIVATLGATRGNQIKAAHLLGLNRNTLRKKIRELDIPVVRGLK